MKASRRPHETQYHLDFSLSVDGGEWGVAVNVGTDDDDDRLRYKLAFDYAHPMLFTLETAADGPVELTGTLAAPALDLLRGDVLSKTGAWRESDTMDGSDQPQPATTLKRLLTRAFQDGLTVVVFGRLYAQGDGIHDVHMNQGSTKGFLHRPGDNGNDHNEIWQDEALFVRIGEGEWAAYFSAFTQQLAPTDDLGNPVPEASPIQ